ncbi:MAG TPA: diguanylate cyclase [Paucimonas sp.]|nr:diguanylate cyclase [Paucimonas sp.]
MGGLNQEDREPDGRTQDHARRLIVAVRQVSLARSLDQITGIVRHEARRLTGADGAALVLREHDCCYYVDEDAIGPLWKGKRFPIDECISGLAMKQGLPIAIDDVYADARIPIDLYRPTFVKSMLMVPIRAADPVGAIGNYWASLHHPSEDEVCLLQALADTTAVTMEKVLLYAEMERRVRERTAELAREVAERKRAEEAVRQLAISDALTGLLNRRGFYLQASQALKVARRSNRPGLLMFADIDELKHVNDTHGHLAGDQLIIDAAAVLRGVLRESDVLGRIGGDEFAVFSLDTEDPMALRNRIREAISRFNDRHSRSYRLSLSIGLTGCDPSDVDSLEVMLERADAAMYRDKRNKHAPAQSSH